MKKSKQTIIIFDIIGIIVFGIAIYIYYYSPQRQILRKLKSAIDVEDPITRNFALDLASKYPGKYNIDQVCNIYDNIYKNWRYVNDPRGHDYFSRASETITNNLTGDCDDFAILMAATIESIGGRTRINIAVNENTGEAHAFTEVYFNDDPEIILKSINSHYENFFQFLFGIPVVDKIHYTLGKPEGIWLNLDWNSKYPGGEYFNYTKRKIYYPLE